MVASVYHVVFNASAAGLLRQALRQVGRRERVLALSDYLSFGPINPPDPALRARWVEKELGYTDMEWVADSATTFWSEALSTDHRKITWVSRRSAAEYAGFLEWIWRLEDDPAEVVDLTDVTVAGIGNGPRRLAISLAMLHHQVIVENDLLDRAETLTSVLRNRYRKLWRHLKEENAPLRVLSEGGLVSAPLSFFDPLLMLYATPQWRKAMRIVGAASAHDLDIKQTGDLVLYARVRALAETGRLEYRGDLADSRTSEVRLPSRFIPMDAG